MAAINQERPTTTGIDFLPVPYRQRGVKRRTYTWRMAVAVTFAALFVVTALVQRRHHQQVLDELAETQAPYSQAVTHNAAYAKVRADIQSRGQSAELLTFVRHPWPRTGVIAAVMAPLAEGIRLTELQVSHEVIHTALPLGAPAPESKVVATDKSSRRARDLKRLLSESAGRQDFVSLSGNAVDAAVLHQYLARLANNPLFAKIDLRSIENSEPDAASGTPAAVRFVVRAVLRASHGQAATSKPSSPLTVKTGDPTRGQP